MLIVDGIVTSIKELLGLEDVTADLCVEQK